MARIQILELPSIVNGDDVETPFAVIIDNVGQDFNVSDAVRADITEQLGAVGTIITSIPLDVA